MLLRPGTEFNLFSSGLAINLDVSSGEAPSKKTATVTKGKVTFGLAAIGILTLEYEPTIIINTAKRRVVLVFFNAKSIIFFIGH